ncbi:MobF family relaxase [Bordetella genomosp. 11]|uniref:TrwC protein n=1 Tax=Bordetella genomosp. 11 TaxID=1416808 RepID=A0A261UKG1_9BORD|nr:MobF family relaxase [Bordetella genomosp. 11]OZI62121.1 TrwC protein [Bordetella genomosp. 11]
MISRKILHRHSAGKAMHYYSEQKDDYFSREGGAAQWQGKAAAALGLTGEIDPAQFADAMRGDFGPGIQLPYSVRLDSNARAALDLTFSAPKSVSIQALVGKDAVVLAAHDQAVTRALEFLEAEMILARRKENGSTSVEHTGNAAIAKWRHETSRPSRDALADPQLHTHALILNITQRADRSWTAMGNEEIFRSLKLLDAVYQAELATQLEKAGYALRHEGGHFELAHISRQQIEAFSKRSMTIEAELAQIGETRRSASHGVKQTVTLRTRQAKTPEVSRETLQADWERQAKELHLDLAPEKKEREQLVEREFGGEHGHGEPSQHENTQDTAGGEASVSGRGPKQRLAGAASDHISPADQARERVASEALRWAIKHLTERESVMREKNLLETTLNHSRGTGVTVSDVQRAIRSFVKKGQIILGTQLYRPSAQQDGQALSRNAWIHSLMASGKSHKEAVSAIRRAIARRELVPADPHYTTQAAREREKRILQIEREGRGKVVPILSTEAAQASLAGRSLKPGQVAAGELILSTSNRVVGVQGLAGTGKSHMLDQVKNIAEESGHTVRAVASYGMQIRALRELGVEANTIASVLEARNQDRFKIDDKTVLVVDEAGVVPTRLMERLLQRAEAAGARVVLLGDTGQTKAIEAGRPFHQLQDAGMPTALMGDIIRQKDPHLKEAVELAAAGRAPASLDVLDTKLQSVHQVSDNAARYEKIAQRYATLAPDDRRETLIVTGTNDSRNALNDATHDALGLAGCGFVFEMLTRRDTTQAERRQAKYYQIGDVIQPERNYVNGVLVQGKMYRIVDQDMKRNRLTVELVETGARTTFNPSRAAKLSVYQPVQAELSAGDWVRVTRNDAARDLVNGARFEVLAVTPTSVTLGSENRTVLLDARTLPLHLDRAYATTSHSAQGLTADRVLINAESFSRTTKQDVYYVAVSRARYQTDVYTDDRTKLPAAVARHEGKSAALDIGLAYSDEGRRVTEPVHER